LDEPVETLNTKHEANLTTPLSPLNALEDKEERLHGLVEFRGVSFQYPHQDQAALKDVSFTVAPQQVVALVGPSGSGKSTILYLLAGFAQPQYGDILIDGRSLSDIGLGVLRQNIGLVSQRVMLFDETIRQNILLGRPHATDAEVVRACQAAHAWSFIEALPQGLDTPLGSLGDRLSGGQRQRIAIARAFLKDAPILLLDEATSALDKESEQAVLAGLNDLMAGRTVILVSHAPERLANVTKTIRVG
jgi:subfamily B ATP-binding cassette protein MsbA